MSHHNYLFILISLIQLLPSSHAEITFDGSFDSKIKSSVPNYSISPDTEKLNYFISADNGELMGSNLFHSFGTFNISDGETATFIGSDSIANIIGRVTGGDVSRIDGTLKSTIPNADLYLLNPDGFMLGKNARVNINGSLYLSSANYLRFANGWQFDVETSTPQLLSVAAPTAFGFLDSVPGDLTIKGDIKVAEGKKIAVIGGDIQISDGGYLLALRGHINLVSAASKGEIMRSDVSNHTLTEFGDISIEHGLLNVSTEDAQSGSVMILGGQFFMSDSRIKSLSDMGTGDIKITSTEQLQITDSSLIRMGNGQGNAGKMELRAQNIELSNGGAIISESSGEGQGGSIDVSAIHSINMDKSALQAITSFGEGNAGNIDIETNYLKLSNGAQINASSEGNGKGGTITIKAEQINLNGYIEENGIKNPSGIASSALSSGNSGKISINTDSLKLDNWATIQTLTKGEGNAGDISINVNDLRITNGADIDASNEGAGTGKAGNINIIAKDSVFITAKEGIDLKNRYVVKDGYLGGIYSSANKNGTGGDITLSTKDLTMHTGGVISVGSQGKKEGNAGNINLNIGSKLNMDNAAILTKSQQAGGDISIKNPDFFTVNKSQILANANNKDGGNIRIIAEQFIKSSDSFLDASSELGIDGSVQIDAPQTNIGDELVVLPRHLLRARLQEQCATLLREDESHFVRVNWLGVPRDELEGGVLGSHHDLEPKQ